MSNDLKFTNRYHPYISKLKFFNFKNIQNETVMEFESPITILTGPNGSGKSSILHALYGVPEGRNIGKFWFSSSFDEIDSDTAYVYEYPSDDPRNPRQILIKRAPRPGTDSKKENPNYWEVSKSAKKYLMNSSGKRGEQIKKHVEYIDFRANLTAYDKFMYFKSFTDRDDSADYEKQDFIRKQTKCLKKVLSGEPDGMPGRKINRLQDIVEVDDELLGVISRILSKNYSSIKIINHKYFVKKDAYDDFASTIVVSDANDLKYSDAYAGSGESSVISLVVKLHSLKEKSLVVLDEPETSIHPEAQKRLVEYIKLITREKSLQVVISTHSAEIVSQFDEGSIRSFYKNFDGTYSIKKTIPSLALHEIGITESANIIVEDVLTSEIIKRSAVENSSNEPNVVIAGGADSIFNHYIPNLFFSQYQKQNSPLTIFAFDGDQKSYTLGSRIVNREELLLKEVSSLGRGLSSLQNHIKDILRMNDSSFKKLTSSLSILSGDNENKEAVYIEFIQYLKQNIYIFPFVDADTFLWDKDVALGIQSDLDSSLFTEIGKENFETLAKKMYGEGQIDSSNFLSLQKIFINRQREKIISVFQQIVSKQVTNRIRV